MLYIRNILIEEDIVSSYFECNLQKCKGACCTFPGEFGAPLANEEIYAVEACLPQAMKYLSEKSKRYIEGNGWFDSSSNGLTTKCIGKKDCVFVYYDGKIAKCALEKAFFNKETVFRKPISCHLFPIRVSNGKDKRLYYMQIDECKNARKTGKQNNIKLAEFLCEALKRAYGAEFYQDLKEYIDELYAKDSFLIRY